MGVCYISVTKRVKSITMLLKQEQLLAITLFFWSMRFYRSSSTFTTHFSIVCFICIFKQLKDFSLVDLDRVSTKVCGGICLHLITRMMMNKSTSSWKHDDKPPRMCAHRWLAVGRSLIAVLRFPQRLTIKWLERMRNFFFLFFVTS